MHGCQALPLIFFRVCYINRFMEKKDSADGSAQVHRRRRERAGITILAAALLLLFPLTGVSQETRGTVSLLFIGDVMQHQGQLDAALRPGCPASDPDSYDYSRYFVHIAEYIEKADLTIANMEFPVGFAPYSGYPAFSAPASLPAQALKSGVDIFLVANNHICDRGAKGIESTISCYESLAVPFTGSYRDRKSEMESNPLIVNVRGIRIALINFTYGTNGIPVPEPYKVNFMDVEHIRDVIARARQKNADLIIALPHWGEEYTLRHSFSQEKIAQWLIANGVDAVIGSHPHTLQDVGTISGKPVVYSLGNFISNMSLENTRIGLMVRLDIVPVADGKPEIREPQCTYIWCSRAGRLEKSFTTIPIEEFIGKEDLWLDKSDYQAMVRHYERFKNR
jgi:hypothetical protein